MAPLIDHLSAAITAKLRNAAEAAAQQAASLQDAASGQAARQPREPLKGLTKEQAVESTAAATLLNLIVQLSEAAAGGGAPELSAELQQAAKAAAAVAAADFGGGVMRLPKHGISLIEACLEVSFALAASSALPSCSSYFSCCLPLPCLPPLPIQHPELAPRQATPPTFTLQAIGRLLFKQPGLMSALLDGDVEVERRSADGGAVGSRVAGRGLSADPFPIHR